jgi:hypothetical protein
MVTAAQQEPRALFFPTYHNICLQDLSDNQSINQSINCSTPFSKKINKHLIFKSQLTRGETGREDSTASTAHINDKKLLI